MYDAGAPWVRRCFGEVRTVAVVVYPCSLPVPGSLVQDVHGPWGPQLHCGDATLGTVKDLIG